MGVGDIGTSEEWAWPWSSDQLSPWSAVVGRPYPFWLTEQVVGRDGGTKGPKNLGSLARKSMGQEGDPYLLSWPSLPVSWG